MFTYCNSAHMINDNADKLSTMKCFNLPYLLLYPELQQMTFYGAGEEEVILHVYIAT